MQGTTRDDLQNVHFKDPKFQKHLSICQTSNGQFSNSTGSPSIPSLSVEEKMEVDGRSVYVGNVDYGATAEELEQARMTTL